MCDYMDDVIYCLDNGYVRLVDSMGNDLSVTNAARASFEKESTVLSDRDKRLIKFLADNNHVSPFRHATLEFEIYAPLMICRQWWKYAVASSHVDDQLGHNESSRRYITEQPTFYTPTPTEWRSAPESAKQGSGAPVDEEIGGVASYRLQNRVQSGLDDYNWAIEHGICVEQARMFLNAYALYVRWRWCTSLAAVCNMLNQRLSHDAQKEFQVYARAVYELTKQKFPASVENLVHVAE